MVMEISALCTYYDMCVHGNFCTMYYDMCVHVIFQSFIFEWVLHFEGREDEGKDGEAENRKAGVGHEN